MSRPQLFTEDQVRGFRAIHRRRQELLAELRTLPSRRQLAEQAGVCENAMALILAGKTYKRVAHG